MIIIFIIFVRADTVPGGMERDALANAQESYDLTDLEKDIIYSHMWPLNITHIPHYRESVIVGIADKYTASRERLHQWRTILSLCLRRRTV